MCADECQTGPASEPETMVQDNPYCQVERGSARGPIFLCHRGIRWCVLSQYSPPFSTDIYSTGAMMNGLQTLPQWRDYFGSPQSALLGTINAVYPIGKIIALFPCTWLSDRYGRKVPMFFGFIFLLVGAALQGAAQNLPMFIISRLILGGATALIAQPSPILITELAYPTQRGQITALYNTFYVSLQSNHSEERQKSLMVS